MRFFGRAVVIAIVGLLLTPTFALAAAVDDPRDVGPSKLDIARLKVVRVTSGDVVFRIVLHTRVSNFVLLHRTNGFTVLLDLDGDSDVDLTGGTRASRGELPGTRNRVFVTWSSRRTGDLTVRRPGPKTFRWRVPAAMGVFPAGAFKVAAFSSYFRRGLACDPACYDFVPAFPGWLTVS
jgi:hypothetical protein